MVSPSTRVGVHSGEVGCDGHRHPADGVVEEGRCRPYSGRRIRRWGRRPAIWTRRPRCSGSCCWCRRRRRGPGPAAGVRSRSRPPAGPGTGTSTMLSRLSRSSCQVWASLSSTSRNWGVSLAAVVVTRPAGHRPGDVDAHEQVGLHLLLGGIDRAVPGDVRLGHGRPRLCPRRPAHRPGVPHRLIPNKAANRISAQQRGRGCRPRRISPVDPAVMVIRAVMMMSHGLSAPLPSLDGQGGVLVHLVLKNPRPASAGSPPGLLSGWAGGWSGLWQSLPSSGIWASCSRSNASRRVCQRIRLPALTCSPMGSWASRLSWLRLLPLKQNRSGCTSTT